MLPETIKSVLVHLENYSEWLAKEALVDALISYRPLTSNILGLVETILTNTGSYLDPSPIIVYPIYLVRKEGGMKLLESGLKTFRPASLTANHVGRFIHVQYDFNEVDALGISKPSADRDLLDSFWLLVTLEHGFFRVLFYSRLLDASERARIIDYVKVAIEHLINYGNQQLLLIELNETHFCRQVHRSSLLMINMCSKYLMPAEQSADAETDEEEDVVYSDMSGRKIQFEPGQFECPLVATWSFELHWRFKPGQAINSLIANVLHPLSISNRKNYFVYASTLKDDEGRSRIFYFRLKEVANTFVPESGQVGSDNSPSGQRSSDQNSVFDNKRRNSPRVVSVSFTSPGSRASAGSTGPIGNKYDQSTLFLEVFGTDVPGEDFQDFMALIEGNFETTYVRVTL
jgi:hypothetical protein